MVTLLSDLVERTRVRVRLGLRETEADTASMPTGLESAKNFDLEAG